ncbi:MAG: hypothetical protein ACRD82_08995 [Blastocatellia bacterium]
MNMNTQNNSDSRIESDIIRTLNDIGFPSSQAAWRDALPVIDPDGQTLRLLGHPVMERWEEPYMKKLAEIATAKASGLVTGGGYWNSALGWASRRSLFKSIPRRITSSLR